MDKRIYNPMEVTYLIKEETSEQNEAFYERIKALPAGISMLLEATDTPKKIQTICEQYQLIEKQTLFLSKIVRDITAGYLYFGDMVQELQSQLDLPESKARQVANTLVEELFKPAMEDIKKIQVENFPDRIKATAGVQGQGNVVDLRGKG